MRNPSNEIIEDEDCLVNIMDHEETNIEVQPTLMHTRQHLSTENLFKDIQNTIETQHSYRDCKMLMKKKLINDKPIAAAAP